MCGQVAISHIGNAKVAFRINKQEIVGGYESEEMYHEKEEMAHTKGNPRNFSTFCLILV